jgi:hypothetical protein
MATTKIIVIIPTVTKTRMAMKIILQSMIIIIVDKEILAGIKITDLFYKNFLLLKIKF